MNGIIRKIVCFNLVAGMLLVYGCSSHPTNTNHHNIGKFPHQRGKPTLTLKEEETMKGEKIILTPSLSGTPSYNEAYRDTKRRERKYRYYEAKRNEIERCRMDALEGLPFNPRLWRFYYECKHAYETALIRKQERAYRKWEYLQRRKGRLDALKDVNEYPK